MTGKPSQETAIEALRQQAFDYLTKPCRLASIAGLLGRVNERRQTKRQLAALQHRLRRAEGDSQLVGSGRAMDAVKQLITKVAPTESTVMIRGETGCGKELVARAVHEASLRADQPLIAVNCGAARELDRKRAVRALPRCVHGRGRIADRPVRGRRRRHHLPG